MNNDDGNIGLVNSNIAIFLVASQILSQCGQQTVTSGISGPGSKSESLWPKT